MSTRRKSSVKVKPPEAPQVDVAPQSTRTARCKISAVKDSNKDSSKATIRTQRERSRTLRLEAVGAQPLTDPTLEELLHIKPPCVRKEEELDKEQVAAQRVEEAKEALGKLECEIVSALFPASGMPATVEEVAQRLGMTVKEVRDVADNALRGLRGTKSSRPRLSTVWN
jgi:hypothetical protein